MWREDFCPICREPFDDFMNLAGAPKLMCNRDKFHISIHKTNGSRSYEIIYILPYILESYCDEMNIYLSSEDYLGKHFIVAIPYPSLPWEDKQAVINKLKLYTVFS